MHRNILSVSISHLLSITILITAALWISIAPTHAADSDTIFQQEIERLAETSGGTMGVGIMHLESGTSFYLNNDQMFPYASVFKVPVAVKLLKDVEAGILDLSAMITIQQEDMIPSSPISTYLRYPGAAISIRNLMELMITESDNTATDILFDLAGGGEAITTTVRALGINAPFRVDTATESIIRRYFRIPDPATPGTSLLTQQEQMSAEEMYVLANTNPDELDADFRNDPRDQTSPQAMVELLAMIWRGQALNAEHTELLKGIMSRTRTGDNRLRALLPNGTPVANKTGTIGKTTNDTGVITLPHNQGHVIVVALVKASERPIPEREKAIAEIARAAHDYFTFYGEMGN